MCGNFTIWCFFNLIKPDEVGKPIANETSQQFWHYEELSSLYLTLIDREPASFIVFYTLFFSFFSFFLLFLSVHQLPFPILYWSLTSGGRSIGGKCIPLPFLGKKIYSNGALMSYSFRHVKYVTSNTQNVKYIVIDVSKTM